MSSMIKLASNIVTPERAQKLVSVLDGKTYMVLHASVCPEGGTYSVYVETHQGGVSESELMRMVIMMMALHIASA